MLQVMGNCPSVFSTHDENYRQRQRRRESLRRQVKSDLSNTAHKARIEKTGTDRQARQITHNGKPISLRREKEILEKSFPKIPAERCVMLDGRVILIRRS
jgi:hypothetical protein